MKTVSCTCRAPSTSLTSTFGDGAAGPHPAPTPDLWVGWGVVLFREEGPVGRGTMRQAVVSFSSIFSSLSSTSPLLPCALNPGTNTKGGQCILGSLTRFNQLTLSAHESFHWTAYQSASDKKSCRIIFTETPQMHVASCLE